MDKLQIDLIELSKELNLKDNFIKELEDLKIDTLYYQDQGKYLKVFYKSGGDKKIKIAKTIKSEIIDLKKLDLLIALFKYYKILNAKLELESELKILGYKSEPIKTDDFITIAEYINKFLNHKEISSKTISNTFRKYFNNHKEDLNFKLEKNTTLIKESSNYFYIFQNSKYSTHFS